jgi:septal ring-binding cell division protein DamX
VSTDTPGPPDHEPDAPDASSEPVVEAPAAEIRCSNCDALLAPDQTYCLECGTPTQIAPQLRRNGRAAWIVGLGLVLAGIGAGALAYAVSGDDDSPNRVATTGTLSDGGTTSFPEDTTSIDTQFPSVELPTDTTLTETPTETTDTVDTAAFVSDWPSGRTAFTAILSSVTDLAEAQATAERARATGESAGVLFSTDHAGLTPGYYVVYSGVFDSRAEAVSQAQKLASSFPGANARRIVG